MGYWVYILKSKSSGRYYCGQTDDLDRRFEEHNDPDCHFTLTTKRFSGPWELIWKEAYETRSQAMRRERQIKKRGIGRFLKNVGGC